jgi:hypothetical protein
MLSKKQLTDICMLGSNSSSTCRYLSELDGKYHCCKLNKGLKKMLDDKAKEIIKAHKDRGTNAYDANIALSDNCQGYIGGLKLVEQGYDIKP